MQQVATGPDIWRRASQSPAPRPILKAPQTTLRAPRRPLRRPHTSRVRLLAFVAASALAIGAGVLTIFLATASPTFSVLAEIERLAEQAGLGLSQVSLTGQRHTADEDVFDALNLGSARTMLSFDSRAARSRIERLPWVERVTIERVVPDRLDIHITERAPFATWQVGARQVLIDKTGRVLGPAPTGTALGLPRFAGEGAAQEAAKLWGRLGEQPALRSRVDVVERVGERRWTLHLVDGSKFLLPADNEADAVVRAAALMGSGRIGEFDLRVPGRMLVREVASVQDDASRAKQARNATGGS